MSDAGGCALKKPTYTPDLSLEDHISVKDNRRKPVWDKARRNTVLYV